MKQSKFADNSVLVIAGLLCLAIIGFLAYTIFASKDHGCSMGIFVINIVSILIIMPGYNFYLGLRKKNELLLTRGEMISILVAMILPVITISSYIKSTGFLDGHYLIIIAIAIIGSSVHSGMPFVLGGLIKENFKK